MEDDKQDLLGKMNLKNEYWLAEIKSQEDSARQIISISIILLGLSVTLFGSFSSQLHLEISSFINESIERFQLSGVPNDSFRDVMDRVVNFIVSLSLCAAQFLLLFSSTIVWILAIDTARCAIRLENIENSNDLEEISHTKSKYVSYTISILIWGAMSLASLLFTFLNFPFQHRHDLMASLDLISFISTIVWAIAISSWLFCISMAFYYWQKERLRCLL